MMTMIRGMWACRWAARRIERYLDSDPALPLDPTEMRRLENHLAVCARCRGRADEYRALRRALRRWASERGPDPAQVARLQGLADRLFAPGAE